MAFKHPTAEAAQARCRLAKKEGTAMAIKDKALSGYNQK